MANVGYVDKGGNQIEQSTVYWENVLPGHEALFRNYTNKKEAEDDTFSCNILIEDDGFVKNVVIEEISHERNSIKSQISDEGDTKTKFYVDYLFFHKGQACEIKNAETKELSNGKSEEITVDVSGLGVFDEYKTYYLLRT